MRLPRQVRESFRRYGSEGGRARAARMQPEARRAVARRAATVRWVRARFGDASFEALGLPGGDLVDAGLADLADGNTTLASLLVSLAAPRLRREGVPIRSADAEPEQRLYDRLAETEGDLAHARYVAYLRQVVSFADALTMVRHRRDRRAS